MIKVEKLCLREPHRCYLKYKLESKYLFYMWLIIFCYLQFKITHPDSEDLAFLYGTILTDGKDTYSKEPTTNICVFADEQVLKLWFLGTKVMQWGSGSHAVWTFLSLFILKQVDRSPTGSGVTARIALQYHKGLLELNQTRAFKSSATGSVFTGKAVRVSDTLTFFCKRVTLETEEVWVGRVMSFFTQLSEDSFQADL